MTQRSRWALPATTEPENVRCFKIEIPDDKMYIAAFKGALYDLCKPYAWQNDDEHTALMAGNRMLLSYASIEEVSCEAGTMQIRACENNCGIEYSTDGENWTCVDLTGCIADIVGIGIDNAIQNGVIQQNGGQQNPGNAPEPDSCNSYHVVLRATDRWLCPVPIATGFSIRVSNASGGWSDGSLAWYCPDGARYLAGSCSEQLHTHQEGDPLNPDAWHMQIVASVDDAVFGDPLAAAYVVPAGYSNGQLWLQANDGSLSDNQGQIEFDVEVCNGQQLDWYHEWDFTVEQGTWSQLVGYYAVDTGFYTSYTGSTRFELIHSVYRPGHATYVKMIGDYDIGSMAAGNAIDLGGNHYSQPLVAQIPTGMSTPFLKEYAISVDFSTNLYLQLMTCYNCAGGYGSLRLLGIGGTGDDPLVP